ncbi:MAG: acyl-CoA thioesterase [Candidatus Dormibacteraceae bacterium]
MRGDTAESRDPSDYPYVVEYQIRLADADAMGIVHHSRYLPYLEEARAGWVCEVGGKENLEELGIVAPVVELQMRYLQPARPRDFILVHLRCSAVTAAKLTFSYLVQRRQDRVPLLLGSTTHGFLEPLSARPQRVPAWLTDALTQIGALPKG